MSKSLQYFEKKYRITPKEYEFFCLVFVYAKEGRADAKRQAYIDTHKHLWKDGEQPAFIDTMACRLYSNVYDKFGDNFTDLLEISNLGRDRLRKEIEKGLGAKKNEYFKGELIDTVDDNPIQAKTRDLLADVLGVKKKALDITTTEKEPEFDLSQLDEEELELFKKLAEKAKKKE